MFRRHFPLDRISYFCADPSSLKPAERSEVARHLSQACRRCWSAVCDVAPGSVASCGDSVAEALHHVATPQSLAVLTAFLAARLAPCSSEVLGSAIRWAAVELEAAGELFATSTDIKTQEARLVCLIRLYCYIDRERAAATCKEAMGRFNLEPYLMTPSDPEFRDLCPSELRSEQGFQPERRT